MNKWPGLTAEKQTERRAGPLDKRYVQCDQIGRFIAILGNYLKSMCTFVWPKLLGNFKEVKIFHLSIENCLGNF